MLVEGSFGRMIGKAFCKEILINEKILEHKFHEISILLHSK